MSALPRPHEQDVIIHRDPGGTLTIEGFSGTPQIACATFEEALQRAGSFASHQHVRVWYTSDGVTTVPLANVALLCKIWNEYVEMRGLRLTCAQAQRLWALDADSCGALLDTLVDVKFLVRRPDGKYARRDGPGDVLRHRTAKADVEPGRHPGTFRHAG